MTGSRVVWVYVHLPGTHEPVLAGASNYALVEEGQYAGSTQAFFAYAASYLQRRDAVSIDPFNLPLPTSLDANSAFETDPGEGLLAFGALRDAAPDSWGRGRMIRVAQRDLDDLDFIFGSGEDRAGFLAFGPDEHGARITAPWAPKNYDPTRYLDLDAIGLVIGEMAETRLSEEKQRQLLLFGSSLGGARPKATIKHDGKIWLAKAPRADDQENVPRGEHAAMKLARRCGIEVPETRIVRVSGKDVYLIERFDRRITQSGAIERLGMVSALSSFGISDNAMSVKRQATYYGLAGKIKVVAPRNSAAAQCLELYRRVIFNILVGNTDDHARNHAFLFEAAHWRLSPLYDVQPLAHRAATKHLAMNFGTEGSEGTIRNLLSRTKDFGLSREAAVEEIHRILERFEAWERVFREAGVPGRDIEGYRVTFATSKILVEQIRAER